MNKLTVTFQIGFEEAEIIAEALGSYWLKLNDKRAEATRKDDASLARYLLEQIEKTRALKAQLFEGGDKTEKEE